jgi:hypothetical protein
MKKLFVVAVSGLDRTGEERTGNFCVIEAESLEAAKALIDKETYEAIGFWAIRRGIGPFSRTRPPAIFVGEKKVCRSSEDIKKEASRTKDCT